MAQILAGIVVGVVMLLAWVVGDAVKDGYYDLAAMFFTMGVLFAFMVIIFALYDLKATIAELVALTKKQEEKNYEARDRQEP